MYCKYCGKQQNDGMFCQYCGKKQFEQASAANDSPVSGDALYDNEQPVSAGYQAEQGNVYQDSYQSAYQDASRETEPDEYVGVYSYKFLDTDLDIKKKSKKPLVVAVIVGVCVLLAGTAVCAALIFGGKNKIDKDDPSKADSSDIEASVQDESAAAEEGNGQPVSVADSSEPEPETEPEIDHTGWQQAYLDKALEIESDYYTSINYGINVWVDYCLYDINGDGFEELYIQTSSGGGYGIKTFCTYGNGKLTELLSDNSGSGFLKFTTDHDGVFYETYGDTNTYYKLNGDQLTASEFADKDTAYCDNIGRSTQSFEEFAGFLGLDVPQSYIDLKKSLWIPASDLLNMSYEEVAAAAPDLRPAFAEEYGATTYWSGQGYTSDKYFPNTIYYEGYHVEVYDGGYIGNNAYVGMRYSEILVLIDSLAGVGRGGGADFCVVDGKYMSLYFEDPNALTAIDNRVTSMYGAEGYGVIDPVDIDPVCTGAREMGGFGGHTAEAEAKERAALCTAPHSGASILWNLEKGEKVVFFGDELPDDEWTHVFFTTSSGVQKIGYIKTKYLKLTRYGS